MSSGKAGTLTGCLCGPNSLWFDAEQYKMSHAWIPLGALSARQFSGQQALNDGFFSSSAPPQDTLPSPVQSRSPSPVVPSDGMIAVADIRRLS